MAREETGVVPLAPGPVDPAAVHRRLVQAGEVLTGLALLGSPQRSALDRAHAWPDAGPVPAQELLAAVAAVAEQARLTARAGRRAAAGTAWLAGTAPHWDAYLAWLAEELEAHATALARVVGDEPGRARVEAALRTARADCAAARLGWAAAQQD